MTTQNLQDMIDDFAFLDNWESRYMHVIDLGKNMAPLSPGDKIPENKVKGCASQVWLVTRREGETLTFRGDSDAHIVKGLVAIVLTIYSGQTARKITDTDAEPILSRLGLLEHLSSQRSNGLRAMIARIKAEAEAVSAWPACREPLP
ncbi:MAG: SufE family protein [Hyphomonadaceae bacterium]|nr:SufE family protein [Hyphomonadaceae bacterium]MBC6412661.1 SufE family protein [Hyphomonadaceae bacterium]